MTSRYWVDRVYRRTSCSTAMSPPRETLAEPRAKVASNARAAHSPAAPPYRAPIMFKRLKRLGHRKSQATEARQTASAESTDFYRHSSEPDTTIPKRLSFSGRPRPHLFPRSKTDDASYAKVSKTTSYNPPQCPSVLCQTWFCPLPATADKVLHQSCLLLALSSVRGVDGAV